MRFGLVEPAVTGLPPVWLNPLDSGLPDNRLPGQRENLLARSHLLDRRLPL